MNYILKEGFELDDFEENADANEEVLLIDNNNNRVIIINQVCAVLIQAFMVPNSIEDIVDRMSSKYEGNLEIIANDIKNIVCELVEKGVLSEV